MLHTVMEQLLGEGEGAVEMKINIFQSDLALRFLTNNTKLIWPFKYPIEKSPILVGVALK